MSHILQNANGMSLTVLPRGGIIQHLNVPDRDGNLDDVVLGFDAAADYEIEHPYFGALIGRYGNRIAGGRFSLDGSDYVLACNNGPNHLHGGNRGFDRVIWSMSGAGEQTLVLQHTSPAGDEGYPGELRVSVTYSLTEDNAFRIDYAASTTEPTPVNLTSHPYFNLGGASSAPIEDHVLEIRAGRYTPVDEHLVPTSEIASVTDTPMDFRRPTPIGERFDSDDEQLRIAGGYDHNWVLDDPGGGVRLAARVTHPGSGRVLEVLTSEPGLQFYSGNSLDGIRGKSGVTYRPHSGFCLETQHFPDSPNQPGFPSTILRPGEVFESTTIYRFSTITVDR